MNLKGHLKNMRSKKKTNSHAGESEKRLRITGLENL